MQKTSAQLDREIAEVLAKSSSQRARHHATKTKTLALADVREQLAAMGVVNSIWEGDRAIKLAKIVVPKSERGAGIGTRAMRLLTSYADQVGKRIELTPSKDFGASSVPRLIAFYKRFGFVENKGRHRDFTTRETMFREPQALPISK